jgi:hypothetical protein
MESEIQTSGEHDKVETDFHRLKHNLLGWNIPIEIYQNTDIPYRILKCTIVQRQEEDNKINPPKNSPRYLPWNRKVVDCVLKDWQEVFRV